MRLLYVDDVAKETKVQYCTECIVVNEEFMPIRYLLYSNLRCA
jgi:hypothetical protein